MASKQQISALWKEVFHDSDKFINLFFEHVYKPENTLYIEKNGEVVSALQIVPYKMKIGERHYNSAYVCGVCTRQSERGKGFMNNLMLQAMETMKKRDYDITFLIPAESWLFNFYKKFGYDILVNKYMETYHKKDTEAAPDYKIIQFNDVKYFKYFDEKQKERKNTVLHDYHDFQTILQDCIFENGNAWIALEKENPVGIAIESPISKNEVFIKDILYDRQSAKWSLIKHIINRHHAETAYVRSVSPNGKNAHAYASACILNDQITELKNDLFISLMLD